jgi:organic radical activating enzyme
MIIKGLQDEDFVNYKKPSMFIAFPSCSWKCEKECGMRVCQNSTLATAPNIEITIDKLVERYLHNPITNAIVIGGLEPFDNAHDLVDLVNAIREKTNDDIVIYTGYTEDEIKMMSYTVRYSWGKQAYSYFGYIAKHPNIIIKFGRYMPNQNPHYDEVLGVQLASDNQYAKYIGEHYE